MKIEEFNVTGRFKYLWMKSVTGVNLMQHCAKSLVGEYIEPAAQLSLDGDVYYLCGVALPFVYKNNFHLAFRRRVGSEVIADRHGIRVRISDAEELPIDSSYIDPLNVHAAKQAYNTCRNWWFAWYAVKILGLPVVGPQ